MVNELIRRRGLLMRSGSSIDWEAMLSAVITGDASIDEFVFPSGVTTLRQGALQYTKFKSVTIPDTVRSSNMREYKFLANNTALVHIDFGNGLNRIDESFCVGCTALTTVTIPSQIAYIEYMAFGNCTSLEEIIVEPTTPPRLSAAAFYGCTALTAIYVPDASVNTYKSASNWSTYASIIKPISQRPT